MRDSILYDSLFCVITDMRHCWEKRAKKSEKGVEWLSDFVFASSNVRDNFEIKRNFFPFLNDTISLRANQCAFHGYSRMENSRGQRSWCIRHAEMCLKKVTRFPTKNDVASEAVKKFTRILLGSCTGRIEPATCQNYFIEALNSASRDFFFAIAVFLTTCRYMD